MAKSLLISCAVCLTICFVSMAVSANGVITFQVEVTAGLKVSSQDQLVFDPVAPEQSTVQNLPLTVWSNVQWELSVQASAQGQGEGLCGLVEVEDERSNWVNIFVKERILRTNQPPTGPEGTPLSIPFRFTGSYEDSPGTYSFQVEFTVVAVI